MIEIDNIIKKINSIDINNILTHVLLYKKKSEILGKNGYINKALQLIKLLKNEDRIYYFKKINEIKRRYKNIIYNQALDIKNNSLKNSEFIDYSFPSRGSIKGSIHPITQINDEIFNFFYRKNFSFIDSCEIEDEYFNFNFLNISKNHPARDMHDTFYIDSFDNKILRTHTTAIQSKIMRNNTPPMKFFSIGKVYRKDYDNTHTPMFHQLEGLWIDKHVNCLTLKKLLFNFLYNFFSEDMINGKNFIRMRPSYFPFTEPSYEIDILCIYCEKNKKYKKFQCKICKNTRWIEILGCGLIHPKILKNMKINTRIYRGIAFGIGIERLCMLKFNIQDIRIIFDNNINFLQQF